MGNMSGVIIRRNPESGVISERFPTGTGTVLIELKYVLEFRDSTLMPGARDCPNQNQKW